MHTMRCRQGPAQQPRAAADRPAGERPIADAPSRAVPARDGQVAFPEGVHQAWDELRRVREVGIHHHDMLPPRLAASCNDCRAQSLLFPTMDTSHRVSCCQLLRPPARAIRAVVINNDDLMPLQNSVYPLHQHRQVLPLIVCRNDYGDLHHLSLFRLLLRYSTLAGTMFPSLWSIYHCIGLWRNTRNMPLLT